ncbi:hypothetical protein C3995_02678 [Escherichia marmotae]|uniref:Uncharacterized protein n=1 Tax=Escherichia marmotae TaxID=1499973 RepID=A0A370V9Y1_9ESCH|nr:hypothetical protein C4A13_04559 [Escherichia marmotae]RDR37053.1 hypothetical protein C4A11_02560 [Escherichia marmotae]RDR38632.1 hypothetical protein C4A14_02581 [Escherichia marmotae]RDR84801.1 hypothetical protein C4A00_02556 [Escherichia marmotae]RDS24860.1 hypothetical protein C3995_02678 [Escherichia marmotae]
MEWLVTMFVMVVGMLLMVSGLIKVVFPVVLLFMSFYVVLCVWMPFYLLSDK